MPINIDGLLSGFNMAEAIATSVAPAILVSGCAIFISALQIKFHNLVDRIRTLDREIVELEKREELSERRRKWLKTAEAQVDILLRRGRLARNAIFILYLSVFFLVVSILIAALGILAGLDLGWATFILFLFSVFAIAVAVINATREVHLSFRVIKEEVANARDLSPLRESPSEQIKDSEK